MVEPSPFTSKAVAGLAVPIPTLLFVESTLSVDVSTVKSPDAASVVNDPAAAVVPPMTELSITAPSKFIATEVPVALNNPSTVSRSLLIFVPQVSVDAPTSGLVKFKFVVNVSAII